MSAVFGRDDRFSPLQPERYEAFPVAVHQGERTAADGPVFAHAHEAIELWSVLEGSLTVRVGGRTVDVGSGEGILINSGRIHRIDPPPEGSCSYVCVQFAPRLLALDGTLADTLLTPYLKGPGHAYRKLRADRFRHREIYEKVKWIHHMERGARAPLWILAALAEIWANFCDDTELPTNVRPRMDGEEAALLACMDAVRARCEERWTLERIAAEGGMGQSKCCQLFAAYLGESPNQYLTRCRLERSAQMLLEGDGSAASVGRACGFSGGSYFTEAFHAHFGLTPTAYRKQAREQK